MCVVLWVPRFGDLLEDRTLCIVILMVMIYYIKGYKEKWAKEKCTFWQIQKETREELLEILSQWSQTGDA